MASKTNTLSAMKIKIKKKICASEKALTEEVVYLKEFLVSWHKPLGFILTL